MIFDDTLYARDDEMDEFGDSGAYGDSLEEDYEEEEEEEEAEVPGMIEPQPEPATPAPAAPRPSGGGGSPKPPRKPAAKKASQEKAGQKSRQEEAGEEEETSAQAGQEESSRRRSRHARRKKEAGPSQRQARPSVNGTVSVLGASRKVRQARTASPERSRTATEPAATLPWAVWWLRSAGAPPATSSLARLRS